RVHRRRLGGRDLSVIVRALLARVTLVVTACLACVAAACGGARDPAPDALTAAGIGTATDDAAGGALSPTPNRRPSEEEGRLDAAATPGELDAFDEAMRLGDAALYSGQYELARVHFMKAMDMRVDSMSPALGALRSLVVEGQAEA